MTHQQVRIFLGWLSAEFPELHNVEIPRFDDALQRFLRVAAIVETPPDADQALALLREWREYQRTGKDVAPWDWRMKVHRLMEQVDGR